MNQPQKTIKERYDQLIKRLNRVQNELLELKEECHHPNVIKKHGSNTGHLCRTDDEYWTDYKCPDCGKFWSTPQ
jgi:hypothetical protein